jgi:hypothetical protein
MDQLHAAVIMSLRKTFSAESFEERLKKTADDESAREARAAERATLLARIPVLSAEAERLANAVAAGSGTLDVLLAAIKARQTEREQAEARLADLEGTERDPTRGSGHGRAAQGNVEGLERRPGRRSRAGPPGHPQGAGRRPRPGPPGGHP